MDRFDWLFLGGLVLIAGGLAGFYWQLGPIALGAGLVALALLGARGGAGGAEEGAGKGGR